MSVIKGQVSVELATEYVLREPPGEDDTVRYTQAEALIEHGFEVCLKPTPWNPDHTAVVWSGDWDDDTCDLFRRSFGDESGEDVGHE